MPSHRPSKKEERPMHLMHLSLYDVSVPALIRILVNLEQILNKASAFATQRGMSADALLERRLHPDMFPLSRQVEILVSGAKGSVARLGGRVGPDAVDPEFAVFNRGDESSFRETWRSFGQLQSLVQDGVAYLKTFTPDEINAASTSITVSKADARSGRPGEARIFETRSFVLDSVLPNAYFHIGMVYALLRSAGVDLGKKDFEGAPVYRLEKP
ncbi:DUF1993 domain-containing protein [Pendulispora brunnea]|uniref:DUF1993 domain-containing protein n=1 Tax=Pendulispora brunnea TaxID=2905690 RepID=A0ABZ2K877_9BACT